MTTERVKSIGILIATLIIGIFLGLLIPGFYYKATGGHHQITDDNNARKPDDWFVQKLNEIVKPDSLQQEKIKPLFSWAGSQLDSVEQSANAQAITILDSVKTKLRSIVTDTQWSRLEKYEQQAKSKWHRHSDGR
jgi:hypothetical protein